MVGRTEKIKLIAETFAVHVEGDKTVMAPCMLSRRLLESEFWEPFR